MLHVINESKTLEVKIPAETGHLDGILHIPMAPVGTVLFVHGSGSSRFSPRNQYVAGILNSVGVATLLLDLLSEDEEVDRAKVFDTELLARRLHSVVGWVEAESVIDRLPIGLFGASTGAAAALITAALAPTEICAVVSRGGRPDLAGKYLSAVQSPTLLLVGGADDVVLDLNRAALNELTCEKKLVVVPGATHLFEEPGTLEEVARLASEWFVSHFSAVTTA